MNNKKIYILIIVFLVLFALIMYITVGKDNIKSEKNELSLILNNNTIFNYSNKNWTKEKVDYIDNYNFKEYSIYLDSKYVGDYYIWHDDQWYLFDQNNNAVNYTEKFLAVKSNYNIKVKEFEIVNNDLTGEAGEIFNKYKIYNQDEITENTKIIIDIDNDGKDEEIYSVSNVFPMFYEPEKIFSYVFMKKDNKIYYMYEYESEADSYSGCIPQISAIFDSDEDGISEIALTCSRYSDQEPLNSIYRFRNNAFELVISSE